MGWQARAVTSGRVWFVGVLVLALVGGWWFGGGRALGAVTVETVASPDCSGTRVVRAPWDGQRVQAVELRRTMDCTLALRIRNDSWVPVTLDELRLPLMGPDAGAAVRVETVQIDGTEERPLPRGVAAVFPLDRRLGRDSTLDVTVRYTYRPDGCTALGVLQVPAARVPTGFLLRSRAVQAEPVHFAGTTETNC
ncbi:hypothetical protein [Nocardioides daejeonensis]|uniref:hypothetical protein n=1 Tax=Nocardioides daejeonensis TaxID=1046556 RepID=UPI0013A556E4|nr:hypothetical protein [Nocardioides daejeonensis]